MHEKATQVCNDDDKCELNVASYHNTIISAWIETMDRSNGDFVLDEAKAISGTASLRGE